MERNVSGSSPNGGGCEGNVNNATGAWGQRIAAIICLTEIATGENADETQSGGAGVHQSDRLYRTSRISILITEGQAAWGE